MLLVEVPVYSVRHCGWLAQRVCVASLLQVCRGADGSREQAGQATQASQAKMAGQVDVGILATPIRGLARAQALYHQEEGKWT